MSQASESSKLNVIARAPFHVYYQGPARMISAANPVGNFDILPGHADFFSIMSAGQVVIMTDAEPVVFTINNGIVTVRGDDVNLFVNI